MSKKILTGKEFWNKSASYFGRTINSKSLVYPMLKKLCGQIKGKKVLDVGSATGKLAIDLAKSGARVTGLDFSEEMIKTAQRNAKNESVKGVEFVVADAKDLDFLQPTKFDIIIINILLPHLKTKEEIEKVLKEVRKTLKGDGRILLAEPHPCFDYLLRKEIFKNNGETSYFQSGKPYEFKIEVAKSGKSLKSVAYHWTIED